MPKKLTTEEWINKARIKHGDNNILDGKIVLQ